MMQKSKKSIIFKISFIAASLWIFTIWSIKKKSKLSTNTTKLNQFQTNFQSYKKEKTQHSENSSTPFQKMNLDYSYNNTSTPQSNHLFVVLNLEHRQDRQIAINEEFQKTNISFEWGTTINPRLPEHTHLTKDCFDKTKCPGQVGCQMSHILALENAIKLNLDYIAIIEDDFRFHSFVDPSYVSRALDETMTKWVPEWDVIAGSLNMLKTQTLFASAISVSPTTKLDIVKIEEAQTTTFYIVKKSIFLPLLKAYKECDVKKDYHTAIDQCFKPLQKTFLWVGFFPQLGTQSPSFSDIENIFVNYVF